MFVGSKQHNIHEEELSQWSGKPCANCVDPSRPQQWVPNYLFWASQSCEPAGGLLLLLIQERDVETNPDPTNTRKQVWICCDICHRQIQVRKQISIRYDMIEHSVHLRCAGIYIYLDLSSTYRIHTHNKHRLTTTTPHRPRPCRPPTPPTPPQPKRRHISLFSHVPSGLVKPKPNPLIHPPPTHPTPPRVKHIHMSHTPPTPLTTLISSTSPALDKTPEPRVPPIYALTATTPPPDSIPALPAHLHPHILAAHTHATQTTVHASPSPQQPHSQHRVPRHPYRQTKDNHRTTNTTQAHIPISKSDRNLMILQVNIHGIKNKLEELKLHQAHR